MDIFSVLKELNFPLGQYVVVGSGTLAALGIREAADVDIAVLPELHAKLCKEDGWAQETKHGKVFLKKQDIDIIPELSWEMYPTTTEEAIRGAIIINGFPFLNLEELKKFKKALGREKDFKDIELIDAYLKKQH